jgi:hypothetical protein
MSERKHEMPKPEEISAILAVVSKEIPNLVKGILEAFFSPGSAADIGKAVAAFYKNLKEGGIPEEQALSMTRDYLGTITKWSEALKGMGKMKWEGKSSDED